MAHHPTQSPFRNHALAANVAAPTANASRSRPDFEMNRSQSDAG